MLSDSRALTVAGITAALILLIGAATSPLESVGWVIVFLVLLFIFVSAIISITVQHKVGRLSKRAGTKIMLASLTLTAVIMLRSLQSLGAAETALLLLLWMVMSFYVTRARGGK